MINKHSKNIISNSGHIVKIITSTIKKNLLLSFFILFTVILCILYYVAVKKMIKQSNRAAILCVTMFAFYGITEGFLSNIFMNFSLLFLGNIICEDIPELIARGIHVKMPVILEERWCRND